MRYISALKNSAFHRRILKTIAVAVVLPPILLLIAAVVLTGSLDQFLAVAPPEVPLLLIGLFLLSLAGLFVLRWTMNRQMEIVIEADDQGVKKVAPGKPVEIRWADVTRAHEVRVGRHPPFLAMKTTKGVFRFDPYLVEDAPGAPHVKQIRGRSHWLYSDGRTTRLDFEGSAGYQIIKRFRPGLLSQL